MNDDQSQQKPVEVFVWEPGGTDAGRHTNKYQSLVKPEMLSPNQLLDVIAGPLGRFLEMVQASRIDNGSRIYLRKTLEVVITSPFGSALTLPECQALVYKRVLTRQPLLPKLDG